MRLLTNRQIAEAENRAKNTISVVQMMERAGEALALHIMRRTLPEENIVFFCGKGKNGGDGFAAAAVLLSQGYNPLCVAPEENLSSEAAHFCRIFAAAGGKILVQTAENLAGLAKMPFPALAVDALLGAGLSRPVTGLTALCVEILNRWETPVLAVDIATGLSGESGKVLGHAVLAAETLCFSALRPGQVFYPGNVLSGRIFVADLGIPMPESSLFAADSAMVCKLLPPREAETHKGCYGKAALFCGAVPYAGAALLAAEGALRSGPGLVSLFVPESVYPVVAGRRPEVMVNPFPEKDGFFAAAGAYSVAEQAAAATAVLCGCGIGRSEGAFALARAVAKGAKGVLVLDADGINAFAGHIDVLREEAKRKRIILTPHDGELAKLLGKAVPLENGLRLAFAMEVAADLGVVLVMKGHKTITAAPSGQAVINTTGNPGMAKGGSGDVLAGMVAGFCAKPGRSAFEAAAVAVFLHGLAGDMARDALGETAMLPSDLLAQIPEAMKRSIGNGAHGNKEHKMAESGAAFGGALDF